MSTHTHKNGLIIGISSKFRSEIEIGNGLLPYRGKCPGDIGFGSALLSKN